MAITIDWATKVINVPKADMTLVQSSPFEVRGLDINTFRLSLKALEAGEYGMVNLKTHNHTAPVSLGGITLARVVEIVNGYTITFENLSYAVNITGGNSNISDVTNLNSVSVRSANSVGLVNVEGGGSAPTASQVADAVWDEPLSEHLSADTVGNKLSKVKETTEGLTFTDLLKAKEI